MSHSTISKYSRPVAVICVVIWIVILSITLRYVFGAVLSSGWIIAGLLFSIAAFCGLLMIRELADTILSIRLLAEKNGTHPQARATPQAVTGNGPDTGIDPMVAWSRRDILGLRSHEISRNNRRRAAKRRSTASSAGNAASDSGRQANLFPRHRDQRFF